MARQSQTGDDKHKQGAKKKKQIRKDMKIPFLCKFHLFLFFYINSLYDCLLFVVFSYHYLVLLFAFLRYLMNHRTLHLNFLLILISLDLQSTLDNCRYSLMYQIEAWIEKRVWGWSVLLNLSKWG